VGGYHDFIKTYVNIGFCKMDVARSCGWLPWFCKSYILIVLSVCLWCDNSTFSFYGRTGLCIFYGRTGLCIFYGRTGLYIFYGRTGLCIFYGRTGLRVLVAERHMPAIDRVVTTDTLSFLYLMAGPACGGETHASHQLYIYNWAQTSLPWSNDSLPVLWWNFLGSLTFHLLKTQNQRA
jgi:hypothetical protein